MDFGRPFAFAFEDKDWLRKILTLSLIYLIPFIGAFVVQGWGLEIVRKVADGDDTNLPDLNFESQLKEGFFYFLITFIYILPIYFLFMMPMMIILPLAMIPENETIAMVGILVFFLLFGFFFLFTILWTFVLPAITANFAVKKNFSAAFELKTIFKIVKSNIVSYLVVLLGTYCASYLGQYGIYLFIIGVLPTTIYSKTIIYHLYGQAYRKSISL